jgi:hypothetical protein
MKFEFVTSINDYEITGKQKIFAYFIKYKYNCDLFCESVKVNPGIIKKTKAIDSLAMWRLTCSPLQPQDILG